MPSTIHSILDEFRTAATSKRGMGDAFERLIATYLVTDPIYAERFTDVWLWAEWPNRSGADTGIDLVAKERATGDYCAIQCKFYDPKTQLRQEDLASFFATAGRKFATNDGAKQFTSLLVVSTTDRWSANAEKLMIDQGIPATRLRVQDLQESPIDWSQFSLDRPTELKLQAKKTPRPHQQAALADIATGFASNDRGKLVMACGTGKTYTSLMVAEARAGKAGLVLFLVPSINLLQQTLREWTAQTNVSMRCFAVCSDSKVGRRAEDIAAHDLALPATTDPAKLVQAVTAIRHADPEAMIVVFSTYQSIDVISRAQKAGLPTFSLAICDEAHRTTGVILEDAEESQFVRIHNEEHVKAHKRLYMTATPRLYADAARTKAEEGGAELCSMDDAALYGPEFHKLSFGEAVARGLLADYKVLVLAVDQKYVDSRLQRVLADDNNEINLDDVTKIIGCWNGLSKRFKGEGAENEDPAPMRRAVAFSRSIRDSKHIASTFQTVINEYVDKHAEDEGGAPLRCEVDHVDGTFNVLERNRLLDWLKEQAPENTCRILSNARCLSEGVDVPALDAVLFLNPRDSVVDVVQSVGRVMRAVPGKKYGYVILPISVPAGIAPEIALRDNDRYRVVWQVLQALRAHDDRFNATINQIELNKQRPNNIQVIGVGGGERERGDGADNGGAGGRGNQFAFDFPDIEIWRDAIYARIVLKCGDRRYWEQWAGEVALIAARHTTRLRNLLEEHPDARQAFQAFLDGLHENINPTISEEEAIEMLGQHLITRPVFDALFEGYSFTKNNAVSQAMQAVLNVLEGQALDKEVEQLQAFYRSVRTRVEKIDNAEGKQRVIVELYDKFFKQAFPKMAERLGIVYTPVEVVDFIINSAEHALQEHFGVGLTDKNVHILDPFTGTGTFLVRLLQSGHIKPKDLERKYKEELHANEIVLLAYYIAAINIEETYHGLKGGDYEPFDGIVLTDTFQLAEDSKQGGFGETMFPENNKRVKRQKARDIRVIVGNPPYSAQQDSENDNNKNLEYPILDDRIRTTYAAQSNAKLKKNLYDSYIRAIRWASDRIRSEGIIGFVTNGSFVDANNMDGLRKCLVEEFSTVYCFNLRGNQRTSGETSRREGGKIFGSGSRTPVAITLLIKSPKETLPGRLFYHDIGDYLTREEKLAIVHQFASTQSLPWKVIAPNADGDWVNQRNPEFEVFPPLGDKETKGNAIFATYSQGILSARDAWVYNFSRSVVAANISRMIDFYNAELERYRAAVATDSGQRPEVSSFLCVDSRTISWSGNLKVDVERGRRHHFAALALQSAMYRPYTKCSMYFDRRMNERVYQMPILFPTPRHANIVLTVTGSGASKAFSCVVSDAIPNYHLHDTGQCFPLHWYEKTEGDQQSQSSIAMDGETPDADGYVRRDAITDWALSEYRRVYRDGTIGKEDIFYYVYGVLHSPEYRSRFESSLKKMLPRMPYLKDFWAYSQIGRELAHWHLNYETVEPYALIEDSADLALEPKEHYRVEKMVFAKKAKAVDKSTIIFNSRVRLGGIPSEAYEYIVNGKSAIEWVMERYQVTVDKDSGIRNDPNDWSEDPRYIVDLVKRVVRVSVETMRLVGELPEFELVSIK